MQPVSASSVPSPRFPSTSHAGDSSSTATPRPYQSTLVQYRNGRPDIYQTVTDRIVTALERGVVPWVRPWSATPGAGGLPRNGSTQRPYHGINIVLLWLSALERGYQSPEWYTVKQANALGAHVRKGERGTMVTFWRTFTVSERTDANNPEDTERQIPMLRHYVVFNREQLDGLPASEIAPDALPSVVERVDEIEEFVRRTCAVVIERPGAPAPCYIPALDRIEMPALTRFESREEFYSTLLHEVAHWSGHTSRLARPMTGTFGTLSYAREELVAELSAAFLCMDFQLPGNLQHPEYIATWITVLQEDNRAVFRAASEARQAVAYLYELTGAVSATEDQPDEIAA